jgi:hypothetical protein
MFYSMCASKDSQIRSAHKACCPKGAALKDHGIYPSRLHGGDEAVAVTLLVAARAFR